MAIQQHFTTLALRYPTGSDCATLDGLLDAASRRFTLSELTVELARLEAVERMARLGYDGPTRVTGLRRLELVERAVVVKYRAGHRLTGGAA